MEMVCKYVILCINGVQIGGEKWWEIIATVIDKYYDEE